ncbi:MULTISPECIES: alkene reductase [Symbiopectobacterium]|uniref:alkene reductase n=1 Tax=Symbiopectobacterium TaxID=801 RepID=UPI001A322B18|nr:MULTISPECIES: alkene reductase [Symbiopectobacterium]MBG6246835.1 alkene reductase [Candidatus Symbiopectobacterium sp. PLON1]MBT9430180.1 alkene reductase [Candidatus Symbiopectobacterium endolongispinus]
MKTLFEPFNLSGAMLQNRIVMAPMTRARAANDIADEQTALYYTQRATAGLIVSEGTPISRQGQGYLLNPGIFTAAQIAGGRLTTDSAHSVGGKIFAQLWHVGRVSHSSIQGDDALPVSASSKAAKSAMAFGYDQNGKSGPVPVPAPRQLSTNEVEDVIRQFARAAENAIKAGFDGVEIHGANGYLHEQFLNPRVNDRTDRYSAESLQNRLRFTIDVIDAITNAIGAERTDIRLPPYGQLFDMLLYDEINETYTALVGAIGQRKLAYVHIMNQTGFKRIDKGSEETNHGNFFALLETFKHFLPHTALILAGGLTRNIAEKMINNNIIDLAAFGVPYISNPDLVARLKNNWPIADADRNTFYGQHAIGYIDYPPYKPQQYNK